tara:strand:- start:163 stop:624 length:462 start_codon:yes stop_codon:yes gene_type:complete
MGRFASGKRSLAISDRSGMAFPYDEMVKEWNGSLVHYSEFETKQPQIRRKRVTADAIALQNPRVQKYQQPQLMSSLNPTFAPNDSTVVASGGATVCIANLDLPGDFAFRTQEFKITRDGVTETIYSMVPEDPSLQNRRRELIPTVGKVTVSIS